MSSKKKVVYAEPPADWVVMEIAIPPAAFAVFERVGERQGGDAADVVNHILRLGFEAHALHEREAHANHAQATH